MVHGQGVTKQKIIVAGRVGRVGVCREKIPNLLEKSDGIITRDGATMPARAKYPITNIGKILEDGIYRHKSPHVVILIK